MSKLIAKIWLGVVWVGLISGVILILLHTAFLVGGFPLIILIVAVGLGGAMTTWALEQIDE